MSAGRTRMRRALVGHVAREAERAASVVQLATVTNADDLTLELHESRTTLYSDEITLSQWMRAYNRDTGLEVDDTVQIVCKRTGGEIHWLVVDCFSDAEPSSGDGGDPVAGEDEGGTFIILPD